MRVATSAAALLLTCWQYFKVQVLMAEIECKIYVQANREKEKGNGIPDLDKLKEESKHKDKYVVHMLDTLVSI